MFQEGHQVCLNFHLVKEVQSFTDYDEFLELILAVWFLQSAHESETGEIEFHAR